MPSPSYFPDFRRVQPLADNMYRLLFQPSGRPEAHTRAVRYGLAAAALGELVLADRLVVDFDGGLTLYVHPPTPSDPVAAAVLDTMASQPREVDVGKWLEYFGGQHEELAPQFGSRAEQLVHDRLVTAGHLEPMEVWRPFRANRIRWPFVSSAHAGAPKNRLANLLWRGEALPNDDLFLLGLACAVDLTGLLLSDLTVDERALATTRLGPLLRTAPASQRALGTVVHAAITDQIALSGLD